MEYSSSKKVRLPGISFDFDNSDNSDVSCSSSNNGMENDNVNTTEEYHREGRENIIEEMKSMGFQGATTILPSPQQHSQRTEMASDNNSQTQTPSKQSLTNPPSSNKQPRSASKPRDKSTKISPTTQKLHTTANNLVSNTPNTTLDKVDNVVNTVVDSVKKSLTPFKNLSLAAAGGDKVGGSSNNSSDSSLNNNNNIMDGDKDKKEKGEQTMILDAAADYLYRMENQYNLFTSDDTNNNKVVKDEELLVEQVENGNEELAIDNNQDDKLSVQEGIVNNNGESTSKVEGVQRRTSRRIQDKQIKEVEEKQTQIDVATLAARELRDKLLAAEAAKDEDATTDVGPQTELVNPKQQQPKKGRRKGRGKSSALSMALGVDEDVNTPYKKECIYNLVDNDDENGDDEAEGAAGEEVNGTADKDGEKIKVGKAVMSPLAPKEVEEGGITNSPVEAEVEDKKSAMSNTEEDAPTEDYNDPIPSSSNDNDTASYTSGTPNFLNQEETSSNNPSSNTNNSQPSSHAGSSSHLNSSSHPNSSNNNNEPTDDMTQYLQDESFYIGKEDGFLSSQSVDSSDISETASEADDSADDIVSCEDEDGDTVVQEDGDINNKEGEEVGWDEEWGDSNLEDDDNNTELMVNQSLNDGINLSTLIKESAKMIAEEDPNHYAENREVYDMTLQQTNGSNRGGGGFDSSSASLSPSIDNVVQLLNTSTNDELNHQSSDSTVEEEDVAAAKLPVKEEVAVTPPSSINQTVPNSIISQQQHDFVPTALKNIVSKQEDELSNLLSSIDNIQSTPGRIAQMLQNEEDTDEGLVGIVDMSNVPSAGRGGMNGVMRSGGLSPVKKRLIMDNGGTPMEKKLEPSVVKDEEVKLTSPDDKVESRVPATPASLPQSPAADTSLPPPTRVDVSAIATELDQSSATAAATPQGPPEPVASPPVRSPWLSFLSNNSPTDNNNSQTQSPEQKHNEDKVVEDQSLDKLPAESNTSIPTIQAVEDSISKVDDSSDDDDEYQQSNVEYTTALAIPLEGGDIAQESNATTEEDEVDFIPESMKMLFQDADSALQNAMPTLSPVPPARGGQGRANDKEDAVFTELSLEMEEDAARRLAMEMINTEQAKLDISQRRFEREKLAAEKEAARQAECDRLEKERLERERLAVVAAAAEEEEARRSEAAEKLAAQQEAERQAKLAEEARLKAEEDERLAEIEKLEKIRIEQQLAEEARLERERLAEVERQKVLAEQQRQKEEEDARLLAEEAKRVAEQAELDRLEQERLESERLEKERRDEEARQAEIERLEKDRIERERILAEQKAAEEARLRAEEQERLAAEEAALFQSRLEEGIEQKILANQRATEELERSRDTLIADAAAKFEAQRLEEAARKAASMNHDNSNNGHPITSTSVSSNDNNNTSITSNNNVSITATNDDTFDTAMCSFSGIEKALDNEFFDANDKADALGTTMEDEQVSDNEEKKMNEEEVKDSSTDIDILDRVGQYMNKVAEMDVSVEKSSSGDCPTNDEPKDQPTTMDGDNSRPSSGRSGPALDESILNESMFMPNATASSPEPNEILPLDVEPMLPMSEDDSDSSEEETDDIEAFLPPSMVEEVLKKSTQSKPVVSKPSNSATTSRTKRSSSDRSPLQTNEEKKGRKISSATLKRQERANQSPSSNINRKKAATPPPSNVKPAKKRSKSMAITKDSTTDAANKPIVKLSSATLKRRERANNRPLQSPPTAAKPAKKRSKSIVQTNKSSSLRIMRSEASNSTVVTRGKENNKGDSMTRRSSMKQSLVSMTKSRRQDDSTVQVSNQEKKPKKKIDMDRISRLAKPQRRSMAKPSATSASSTTTNKSIKKRVNGPPSLLTRTAPTRSYVKSTAELEQEEMERVKPFKAKKIHGSIDVPSRYKTAAKRVPRPPASDESSSKPKSSSASRPLGYSPRRQSGLYKPTPSRKKVSTFGESVNHYLHHGLRGPTSKLSTPKPPSEAFLRRQTMSNSHHVKSTEELELEECQKQFKAKEYGYGSVPMSSRRTTMSSYTPVASSEQLELEECRKQFKARPLPGAGGRRVSHHTRRAPQQQQQQGRTLTVPSPFRLHSNIPKPPPPSTDDVELSKPFKARPLPNSSSRFYKDGSNDTPYHVRAQQQYEMSRARKERLAEDDEHQGTFRAKPVPRTTYQPQQIERIDNTANLTQPKTPTLSLKCRAEERKVFDQYAEEVRQAEEKEREMIEQQQREMEEEEIRRLRTADADEGGTCFRARQISIEYA